MKNRTKTVEVTKEYAEAFNNRDLDKISGMFDADEIVFVRQSQPTIIGKDPIIRRTQNLFQRLDKQGHQLHLITAIIDFKGIKALPCMLGILDGERFSVIILDVKITGKITTISILLTNDVLQKARPTEPLAPERIAKMQEENKNITQEELNERRCILAGKAQKLKARFQDEGPTEELMLKLDLLEKAKEKLAKLEAEFDEQHKLANSDQSDNLEEI